ncbi:tetratricopeptide repeat protein [Sphingomonas hankyongi]|uniref:Tetratricopeptide repeat protein n=1 Tax=Sphingomonas hankyongi TaxID=2908209 RepID=A0ABT0RZG1_9SPHN|nr:tetratricopeptide repeat protein [Sphingomonas hankyongi]MCL6728956.1 tetratricopeptide repeat protein [Sphingomonas hankyongi]
MAQPPNITDTFLREVDENLRRDRLADFGKKYGGWMVGAVLLLLAASGGWIYWQHRQEARAQAQVEQISDIYQRLGANNRKGVSEQLDALSKDGSNAVRASALVTRAVMAIEDNDLKLATEKFHQVASDDKLPKPYRDLALIRQTALEFDKLKPEEVVARLDPLAKPGNPWFGTAGEMTAAAKIKQGKKQEAAQLFAAIAKDKTVPDAIRARSVQLAASLGVDVSAALEAPAQ